MDAVIPRDWSYTPWLRTKRSHVASNPQVPSGVRVWYSFFFFFLILRAVDCFFPGVLLHTFGCDYRVQRLISHLTHRRVGTAEFRLSG